MEENKPKQINVKSDKILGSQYSQAVSISTTDIDSVLEFVFVNPRSLQGEVVARISMPNEAVKALAQTINENLSKHYQKKGN